MIRKLSVGFGLIAFFTLMVVGFWNDLPWTVLVIRAVIAAFVFYFATYLLAFLALQSILRQEVHKKERELKEEEQKPSL